MTYRFTWGEYVVAFLFRREILALQAENLSLEKQLYSYQVSLSRNNSKGTLEIPKDIELLTATSGSSSPKKSSERKAAAEIAPATDGDALIHLTSTVINIKMLNLATMLPTVVMAVTIPMIDCLTISLNLLRQAIMGSMTEVLLWMDLVM